MSVKTEKFQFTNAAGMKLDGRLENPVTGKVRGIALFAHCFTCTKSSRGATKITAALAARGIATLRFDFTGLGNSDGEFKDSGFISNVQDLLSAADALRGGPGAPTIIIGHSLGGAAVIAAAEHIPELKAVVTIGAPFEVDHVLGQLGDQLNAVKENGEAEVQIGGRPFIVNREFLDQTYDQPQSERLAKLGKSLLVMHAPDDDIVGFYNAEKIYEVAAQPKSFIALEKADHLLMREEDAQYAANMIAAWAGPHLDDIADDDNAPIDGVVVVRSVGPSYTQYIRTSNHYFLADEPISMGGYDLGPAPYDLLLAGLGACTSMTLKMYAQRKKIPLTGVTVALEHSRDHAEDCNNCNNNKNQIDVIDRTIELSGDLTDEQRDSLIRIADRCPVHRTLENRIDINTIAIK